MKKNRLVTSVAVATLTLGSFGAESQEFTIESAMNEVQGFYVGYYGRPADPGGKGFWTDRLLAEQNLATVLPAFGNSAEFTDLIAGQTDVQIINGLYLQILDRLADAIGESFYLAILAGDASALPSIAKALIDGIQGEQDTQTFADKLAVANYFTDLVASLQTSAPDDDFAPAAYRRAIRNIASVVARNTYHDQLLAEGYCVGAGDVIVPVGPFTYIDPLNASAKYLASGTCSFGGSYRDGGTTDASEDAIFGDDRDFDVVEVRLGEPIVTESRCDNDSMVYEVFDGATRLYAANATRDGDTISVIPTTSKLRFIEVCGDDNGEATEFYILAESKVIGPASGVGVAPSPDGEGGGEGGGPGNQDDPN